MFYILAHICSLKTELISKKMEEMPLKGMILNELTMFKGKYLYLLNVPSPLCQR